MTTVELQHLLKIMVQMFIIQPLVPQVDRKHREERHAHRLKHLWIMYHHQKNNRSGDSNGSNSTKPGYQVEVESFEDKRLDDIDVASQSQRGGKLMLNTDTIAANAINYMVIRIERAAGNSSARII